MTIMKKTKYLAIALMMGMCASPNAVAIDDGDTVTIIVPYAPGGGYDAQARLAAPYIQSALADKGYEDVDVVVQNVSGGAGTVANTRVYDEKPDGTTLLFLDPESSVWQQTLGDVPYEVGDFSFIAQMSVDPMVFLTREDTGLGSFDAVVERSAEQSILLGTAGHGGHDHIVPLLLERMLNEAGNNVSFDYIHLDGTAPMKASIRRGEIEAAVETISIFNPMRREGVVEYLFGFGDQPHFDVDWPDATEVTNLPKAQVKKLASAANYRRVFVGPPEMDKDTQKMLRKTLESVLHNEQLIAESEKANQPIVYMSGPETRKALQNVVALAERYDEYLKEVIQ